MTCVETYWLGVVAGIAMTIIIYSIIKILKKINNE